MIIGFGKYRGQPAESVLLAHPDYVMWALAQDAETGPLAHLSREFGRLIDHFNSLPFIVSCVGEGCDRTAMCCTLHQRAVVPYFWCSSCNPLAERNPPAKLVRVGTYHEACYYVCAHCNNRKTDMVRLIRQLAQAKGLPDRVGEREAIAFFA
jgi:hypothetical protein